MPNLNGIEAGRQISAALNDVQIVMLTVHSDKCYLLNALKAGARGYVLKSSAESEIVDAGRAVSLYVNCDLPMEVDEARLASLTVCSSRRLAEHYMRGD